MLYESAAAIARHRGDHTAMVNGGLEDGSNATDLVVGSLAILLPQRPTRPCRG
jgi:hypothetical protein